MATSNSLKIIKQNINMKIMVLVMISMLQHVFAEKEPITIFLSKEETEFIIYGSEYSPLFISTRIEGTAAQQAFTKLLMQVHNEWHTYVFKGVDHEGTPTLIWINSLSHKPYHLTKEQFITKCNDAEVALYDDTKSHSHQLVVPRYKVPLIFTSTEGPDIVWDKEQFVAKCNDGKVGWQKRNLIGGKRRRFIIGETKKTQCVQLHIAGNGAMLMAKLADDMTGNIWSVTLVPQSKYYLELKDDSRKWRNYQFLGAFVFDDGATRIIVTNIGMKGDNEAVHTFIWSKEEFVDECHNGNIALMSDEFDHGVDLHGIIKKSKDVNKEDRTQVTVANAGGKMNIYGISKRSWKEIDSHYPFYIQSEDDGKWILYHLNEEKMKQVAAHQEGYDRYEEYDQYEGYNAKTIRLLERLH